MNRQRPSQAKSTRKSCSIVQGLTLYRGLGRGGLKGNDLGVIFATTNKDEALHYSDWGSGKGPHGLAVLGMCSDATILDLREKPNAVALLRETAKIYKRRYNKVTHEALYWTPEDFTSDFVNGVAEEIVNAGQEKHGMGQLSVFDDKFAVKALQTLGKNAATDGETYVFTKSSLLRKVDYEP